MPISQKMDLGEMFDMIGERSCGGGWAMKTEWDMNSLWWSICYGRAIQAIVGASDAVPCQYLDVMESIHATGG